MAMTKEAEEKLMKQLAEYQSQVGILDGHLRHEKGEKAMWKERAECATAYLDEVKYLRALVEKLAVK